MKEMREPPEPQAAQGPWGLPQPHGPEEPRKLEEPRGPEEPPEPEAAGPYDDIIGLPRPEPRRHPRMPMAARAAQFMPFAALRGFDDALEAAEAAHRASREE